jgi:hypothetical protein
MICVPGVSGICEIGQAAVNRMDSRFRGNDGEEGNELSSLGRPLTAGEQALGRYKPSSWIPACAGMTGKAWIRAGDGMTGSVLHVRGAIDLAR